MEKVTVRTTFRPDVDVEMTPVEAEDLRRQGLLVEDQKQEEPTPAPEEKAPATPAPARKAEKA